MSSIKWKILTLSTAFTVILIIAGCQISGWETIVLPLFNGKDLSGWKVIPEGADSQNTWSVKDGILYCTGKPNGYIRTEKEYSNYHLHVEWRWPEKPTNSGVFIHADGADIVWPELIECQLMAGNAGDFVLINGTGMTVDGQDRKDPNRQYVIIPKKQSSSEKPAGQWNSYDIYCQGDTIKCLVNDVLQNEGTAVTPSSGYICLQGEGGPIEFRNIYIDDLGKKVSRRL